MFAIRVELLSGRYAATAFDDRDGTEWPPHPARLYSALVATWADAEEPDPIERDALVWLEGLGAPDITASSANARSTVTYFVPNNEAGKAVVRDLSKLHHKLSGAHAELAEIEGLLGDSPGDGRLAKQREKLLARVDRLHENVRGDSEKAAAARSEETYRAVAEGIQLLPEERGRQARTFPVVIPEDPVVFLCWQDAVGTDHPQVLDRLLARVSRLGHSSSMVSCCVAERAPEPTLVPSSDGHQLLRVTADGLLDELEAAFAQHQGSQPRILPNVTATYAAPMPASGVVRSVFEHDWPVLQLVTAEGRPRTFPPSRALELARGVRNAVLSHAEDPIPETLSGHAPSGSDPGGSAPSERTHLAVMTLPYVGSAHADGLLRGVALVLPTTATEQDRRALAGALARWFEAGAGRAEVRMGRSGIARLVRLEPLSAPNTLRPQRWAGPARRWGSVTPVALDRVVRGLWDPDPVRHDRASETAEAVISKSCEHVGLPRAEVTILKEGAVRAARSSGSFPALRSARGGPPRFLVHVALTFEDLVGGPVVIGAGRYFGYGLCAPLDDLAPDARRTRGSEAVAS